MYVTQFLFGRHHNRIDKYLRNSSFEVFKCNNMTPPTLPFDNFKDFPTRLRECNDLCRILLSKANPSITSSPEELFFNESIVNRIKSLVEESRLKFRFKVTFKKIKIGDDYYRQYETLNYGECVPGALSVLLFGEKTFSSLTRLMICFGLLDVKAFRGRTLYKQRKGYKEHGAYIDDTDLIPFCNLFGFNLKNYYFDRYSDKIRCEEIKVESDYTLHLMWEQNSDLLYHIYPLLPVD